MDGVFLVAFPFFRPPSAFPMPGGETGAEEKMKRRDRWQDREKERVNETDDGGRNEKGKSCVRRLLLVLHSRSQMGEGERMIAIPRAKSYSFGPSTTWPRHNRVKVASRLSPRGGFRSAHGRKGKRGERKKKNTRLSLERSESREKIRIN